MSQVSLLYAFYNENNSFKILEKKEVIFDHAWSIASIK